MGAATFSHGDGDYLSDAQLAQLLKSINALRVSKDLKGMSYVEAYEIRAHLNRIFGPLRWDSEVLEQALVYETSALTRKKNKTTGEFYGEEYTAWSVCWRSILRLTLRSPSGKTLAVYTEGATSDATNQPSRADANDQALKSSASQALKRCAMNLGDQFGLSLYNKGSLRPLVGRTLIWDPPEMVPAAGPDEHITSPLAPESGEPNGGESQREVTSPPASKAPPLADAGPVSIPAAGGGGRSGGSATTAETCQQPAWSGGPLCELAPGHPGSHHPQTHSAKGVEFDDQPVEDTDAVDESTAGPTAPDADGGSPAGSGEPASSPAEAVDPTTPVDQGSAGPTPGSGSGSTAEPSGEPDGEAFPTASSNAPQTSADSTAADLPRSDPDPTPTNGSEPTGSEPSGIEDPIDAWEHITAALAVIRMSPPEEALGILNSCMELAVQHRLATRRYLDTDKALSVVLTETMRDARAAIERRRAAAAGAS